MNNQFIRIKSLRGEMMLVNVKHIISIRPVKEVYHVSLTDFGFDISQTEYNFLIETLEAKNLI